MTTEIAVEYANIDDLKPADYNPRRISAHDMAALEGSLEQFGIVDPIIARRENGEVIGGHQRLEAARAKGITRIPVIYLDDLTPEQARVLNLALNRISGEFDTPRLAALFGELQAIGVDLTTAGFEVGEIEAVMDPFVVEALPVRAEMAGLVMLTFRLPPADADFVVEVLSRYAIKDEDRADAAGHKESLQLLTLCRSVGGGRGDARRSRKSGNGRPGDA